MGPSQTLGKAPVHKDEARLCEEKKKVALAMWPAALEGQDMYISKMMRQKSEDAFRHPKLSFSFHDIFRYI